MSEVKKLVPAEHVVKETPKSEPKKVHIVPIMTYFYRGVMPDIKKLSPEEKAAILVQLNVDSKADTVFKDPVKEQHRDRLRRFLA